MKLNEKEKREMREKRRLLNKAWDAGERYGRFAGKYTHWYSDSGAPSKRYRDVTKILKEAEKENHVKV